MNLQELYKQATTYRSLSKSNLVYLPDVDYTFDLSNMTKEEVDLFKQSNMYKDYCNYKQNEFNKKLNRYFATI